MRIKVLKGTNQIGGVYTEIETEKAKILIDFGDDLDDIVRMPNIEGLTCGESKYDGVFITHYHRRPLWKAKRDTSKNTSVYV